MVRKGNGVPALFNDEASIAALTSHGYPLDEARNYAVVGCVELALPGKSFFSTDAGLFNLPLCLELALNRDRRFGKLTRWGHQLPMLGLSRISIRLSRLFERRWISWSPG